MSFRFVHKVNQPYSKYGNKKTLYNGLVYDSIKEAAFAEQLDLLRHAKGKDRVVSWERQVPFTLHDGFTDKTGKKHLPIRYIADFKVKYEDGREEIVDTKGMRTEIFKMKLKMLLYRYPDINFIEI